jgi:hypothetical protein
VGRRGCPAEFRRKALLGQREGTLGFGPVGQEAAGLPTHPRCWACKAPLVGVGEGSISIRRGLTA